MQDTAKITDRASSKNPEIYSEKFKTTYDFLDEDEDKGKDHELVRNNSSYSNYLYNVKLPKLNSQEKEIIRDVERKVITGVKKTSDKDDIDIAARREILSKEISAIIDADPRVKELRKKGGNVFSEEKEKVVELILNNTIGYGLLQYLVTDDDLEEIMVLGANLPVYVWHRDNGMCETNVIFENDNEIIGIIDKIAQNVGRRVDVDVPLLDARLPDGSRVNATLPPISLKGPTLTIRKFRHDPFTVIDLIKFGTLTSKTAAYLWLVVEGLRVKPGNIIISGGSGCGKTTLLNCLAVFIPEGKRLITIEDTAELRMPVKHKVGLETRPPNLEGRGEITMDHLLRNTLRMRPDRIVLGEVRGEEAETLFAAMNTGHNGCMGTMHSNSARETITRLTNPPMNVPLIMIPALDLIVMVNRFPYKKKGFVRRVTEISEVGGIESGTVQLNKIYEWEPKSDEIISTGVPSGLRQKIAAYSELSREDINNEISNRERVIEYMVNRGINKSDKVYGYIQEYYSTPEKALKKVQ